MLQRTSFPSLVARRAPLRVRVPAGALEAPAVRMLRGREAILAATPLLEALAVRSGQRGETDSLPYFLSTDDAMKKLPCLLLVGGRGADAIEGAVVIFEYKTPLGGTRVYATADATGRRTVIAAPEWRARVAGVASRSLIAGGAQVVHITFSETHAGPAAAPDAGPEAGYRGGTDVPAAGYARQWIAEELSRGLRPGAKWVLEERELPLYLPLHATFAATLARIGQRTRSNLRYYRRRSEVELGSRFVAEVEIGREEFVRFNRECTFAVTMSWRHGVTRPYAGCRIRGCAGFAGGMGAGCRWWGCAVTGGMWRSTGR